ncbi:hypothetical protein CORC01_12576 [Colletotrichum orchidophilum]|uniref:Uncharacterized protein n=1 Tax=Colletotrichum orchidophilum TaxID=1209926 RepID=A0A1G4ASP1_9PEZI|nr:uncharacterized protein CORC01_12576 [Colletotrichum orchidophilum]OHE92121.1 hypothetical protein CORC01_12576 [Colletotrichum orchidophilum]
MSFLLEVNLALAVHEEQASTGASNEEIIRASVNALRSIQQRFQNGNQDLPRATRSLERSFTLAILREQSTRNFNLDMLISRTRMAWARVADRLEHGQTPFPEPYHVTSQDEDDSIEEQLRRMGLDPNSFDLTGFGYSYTNNNIGSAQPQADLGTPIGPGGIGPTQAVILATAAVSAATSTQASNAAASGRRRDRKRGPNMYGCDICNQAKMYTSACTLYRHKKKKHGIPTLGDVRKERQRAMQAIQAAQAAQAAPDAANGSDEAQEPGDENEEEDEDEDENMPDAQSDNGEANED